MRIFVRLVTVVGLAFGPVLIAVTAHAVECESTIVAAAPPPRACAIIKIGHD